MNQTDFDDDEWPLPEGQTVLPGRVKEIILHANCKQLTQWIGKEVKENYKLKDHIIQLQKDYDVTDRYIDPLEESVDEEAFMRPLHERFDESLPLSSSLTEDQEQEREENLRIRRDAEELDQLMMKRPTLQLDPEVKAQLQEIVETALHRVEEQLGYREPVVRDVKKIVDIWKEYLVQAVETNDYEIGLLRADAEFQQKTIEQLQEELQEAQAMVEQLENELSGGATGSGQAMETQTSPRSYY